MTDITLTKTTDMVAATVAVQLSTGRYTCRALVNRKNFEKLTHAEQITILRDGLIAQLKIQAVPPIESALQKLLRKPIPVAK